MEALARVVSALVCLFPWRALRAVGAGLGLLAGEALRIRRPHVCAAMTAARVPKVKQTARAMYRSLGTSLAELLWLAARGVEAPCHADLDPESASRWQAAIARGRGVVIAAAHTGNWDLAACTMAREIELLVVTKRLRIEWLDRFWHSVRSDQRVHLSDAHGALARGLGVLRRRGAVAMMIDQVPGSLRHAVEVTFLGRQAWVDRSPAALAAAGGAPLVVAASRRDATGEHVLQVLEVLEPPERPSRAWIDRATASATEALAAFVRAHPDQWLWLHRRWKRPPGLDRRPRVGTLATPWGKIRSSSPGARSKVA